MTALQQLFTVALRYKDNTYCGFNVNHNDVNLISVDLYRPDREFTAGYFAATWLTALSNFDGKREIANSYGRLKRQFLYPNGTNFNEFHRLFGEGVEAHLIFGAENPLTLQVADGCPLDNNLQFGLIPEEDLEKTVREITESKDFPEVFTFLRFDSPYCGHYFGTREPIGKGNEAGVISTLNLSTEVMEFFRATTYHNVPEEHLMILNRKLNELLWRLPEPESR